MEAYVKPGDLKAAQDALRVMMTAVNDNLKAINDLCKAIKPVDALSVEDRWVHSHGETLTKVDAAKVLGVGTTHLYSLISAGSIDTAPDGRVLVRSAAAWANGGKPKPQKKASSSNGCTFRIKP